MVVLTGAHALVEALKREGVDTVFGIPGGAIMPVYDAIKDSGIRHVLARHEQSAAHMADGFARASGRVGVAFATSGPGATNLLTGIATAYMDSVPVVAVTGQVPTHQLGTDAFQEIDTIGVFNPVTKYSFQPRRASEVPPSVRGAFFLATTGRTGPVLIDVPKDVQNTSEEMVFPDRVEIRGYVPEYSPDSTEVERAALMIMNSQRPVILAGAGVIKAGATDLLAALAERLMVPVATTLMGKGSFPENHPLSLGPIGMHGTVHANRLIMESDLVVNIGARFSDRSTMNPGEFSRERKIVHFDIDPTEVGKNIKAEVRVVGNLRKSLGMLLETISKISNGHRETEWTKKVREFRKEYDGRVFGSHLEFSSPNIIKTIREILPPDGIVTTEVGQHQMWAELYYKVLRPRTFITSGGLGTMGFGFPAAIGAKAALPESQVVDIAGDGSFLMTSDSLATSVTEGLPVVVCVFNNSSLGMVAQWQKVFYGGRYSGVWLGSTPDFVQLAKAYRAEATRVQSLEEFSSAFKQALRSEVATVIDIPISPEESVFPFVPPGSSLKEMILK